MAGKPVLIIQCGAKKLAHKALVRDLYLGPFWSTYRARRKEQDGMMGDHSELAVFVLSAKHGLVAEGDEIEPYDMRIVPAGFFGRRSRDGCALVPADTLSDTIRDQAAGLGLARRDVFFVGGKDYAEALDLAGVEFESLSDGGLLAKRSALNRFLTDNPSSMVPESGDALGMALARVRIGGR